MKWIKFSMRWAAVVAAAVVVLSALSQIAENELMRKNENASEHYAVWQQLHGELEEIIQLLSEVSLHASMEHVEWMSRTLEITLSTDEWTMLDRKWSDDIAALANLSFRDNGRVNRLLVRLMYKDKQQLLLLSAVDVRVEDAWLKTDELKDVPLLENSLWQERLRITITPYWKKWHRQQAVQIDREIVR